MSKAVILQHVAHEGPGRIVPVFRDFGIPIETRHLYRGDEVPSDLDELRVLVIMGGPMGVSDVGSELYPFLAKEVELLQRMIRHDRPVLGICLGAQLLAHAAGAKVYPNVKMAPPAGPGQPPAAEPLTPLPEFGWLPVTFPFPGGTEPIVMGLHDGAPFSTGITTPSICQNSPAPTPPRHQRRLRQAATHCSAPQKSAATRRIVSRTGCSAFSTTSKSPPMESKR